MQNIQRLFMISLIFTFKFVEEKLQHLQKGPYSSCKWHLVYESKLFCSRDLHDGRQLLADMSYARNVGIPCSPKLLFVPLLVELSHLIPLKKIWVRKGFDTGYPVTDM